MAFLDDLFSEQEVSYTKARVALEAELPAWQEAYGIQDNANVYLRNWIHAGWLREHDDRLTCTDAFEQALRFVHGLEQRDSSATASHLRIVQDAVRDLSVALSPNPEERLRVLENRVEELNEEIRLLKAGVVPELSSAEQRERIRGIYQLASVLTGDFRHLEDEIRLLDQTLRVQMIEPEGGRGTVLRHCSTVRIYCSKPMQGKPLTAPSGCSAMSTVASNSANRCGRS